MNEPERVSPVVRLGTWFQAQDARGRLAIIVADVVFFAAAGAVIGLLIRLVR